MQASAWVKLNARDWLGQLAGVDRVAQNIRSYAAWIVAQVGPIAIPNIPRIFGINRS